MPAKTNTSFNMSVENARMERIELVVVAGEGETSSLVPGCASSSLILEETKLSPGYASSLLILEETKL